MKKIILLILLSISSLISGCDILSPSEKPNCEITKITQLDATFSDPAKFVITVSNIGDAEAFYIETGIRLKKGNTVIERSSALSGPLNPGESEVSEAWFFKITKHTEYEYYQIILSWYDEDSLYYQKNIN